MILQGFILINKKTFTFKNLYPKFYRNFLALLTGTASQTMIQILSIPLFLAFMDLESYSVWLLSYSIAQISVLLDFGSIAYSQHKLSDLNAQKKMAEIDSHLKQVINILALNIALFLVVISLIHMSGIKSLNTPLIAIFVYLLLLQSLWGLVEAFTRFDSKIATGLYASNALRLGEFLGTVIGVILFSNSLIEVGFVNVLFKSMTFIFLFKKFSSKYRFLRVGKINLPQILSILKGSVSFFLVKMADTIYLSGILIVLNGKVSSGQFVQFVALRTFFRFGLQVTALITYTFAYELSSSWVNRDLKSMQNLIRSSGRMNLLLSCVGFLAYLIFGKYIFTIWVSKKISINDQLNIWGACYSFVVGLNQNLKAKFFAINHGLYVSIIQLAYSTILVLIIRFSSFDFSVISLFILLSFFELICYIFVAFTTRNSINRYFQDLITDNSKKNTR